jgi:predicted small secreted protein
MRKLSPPLVFIAAVGVSACTVQGVGEDIETVGGDIDDVTEDLKY